MAFEKCFRCVFFLFYFFFLGTIQAFRSHRLIIYRAFGHLTDSSLPQAVWRIYITEDSLSKLRLNEAIITEMEWNSLRENEIPHCLPFYHIWWIDSTKSGKQQIEWYQ